MFLRVIIDREERIFPRAYLKKLRRGFAPLNVRFSSFGWICAIKSTHDSRPNPIARTFRRQRLELVEICNGFGCVWTHPSHLSEHNPSSILNRTFACHKFFHIFIKRIERRKTVGEESSRTCLFQLSDQKKSWSIS